MHKTTTPNGAARDTRHKGKGHARPKQPTPPLPAPSGDLDHKAIRHARLLAACLEIGHRSLVRLRRRLKGHACPRKGQPVQPGPRRCHGCRVTLNPCCPACDTLALIAEMTYLSHFSFKEMAFKVGVWACDGADVSARGVAQLERALDRLVSQRLKDE